MPSHRARRSAGHSTVNSAAHSTVSSKGPVAGRRVTLAGSAVLCLTVGGVTAGAVVLATTGASEGAASQVSATHGVVAAAPADAALQGQAGTTWPEPGTGEDGAAAEDSEGTSDVTGGAVLAATATSTAQADGTYQRITGEDRVATAIAVARDRFPQGEQVAVLASGDDFADALAGSALAEAAGGPLLLTGRAGLDTRVAAELKDHLAAGSTVYVLGGTRALAASVDDAVAAAGGEPVRLAGRDRYATAGVIASEVAERSSATTCEPLLVTGQSFPDGAAASGVVAAGRPLLYTAGPSMPFATRAALAACAGGDGATVTAVGGPAAKAAEGTDSLPRGVQLRTVVGTDRYDTSAQLLEAALEPSPAASPSASETAAATSTATSTGAVTTSAADGPVVIASGTDYADALVGGTYQRPVLLTEAGTLPDPVASALHEASGRLEGVVVVGGEKAVSATTADSAAQIAAGAAPGDVRRRQAGSTPTGSPSSSSSASPSGSAGGSGGGTTSLPAGTWLSGASGTGVGDGSFARWRGSELGIVGTWSDNNEAMVQAWAMQPGAEYGSWQGHIDIAIGAIGDGESWQQAATGAYDARWRASLTKMRTSWGAKPGTVYIRFAHEMNGNWYDWSVNSGNKDAFVASWKRFRALQQELFPTSRLVFSVNRESVSSGFNWTQSFPGRQYVDVMGVDYYNQYPYAGSVADFNAALGAKDGYGAPKGLQAHLDFARSQGLPLSVNEWSGISENGDSPGFIQGMHEFFRKHAGSGPGQILYDVQFNCDMGGGKFMLYGGGSMPRSAAKYQELF